MSAQQPDHPPQQQRVDELSQQQRIDELEREVDSLRAQLHAAWGQLQGMRSSASWRVTYPLRAVRRLRRP